MVIGSIQLQHLSSKCCWIVINFVKVPAQIPRTSPHLIVNVEKKPKS